MRTSLKLVLLAALASAWWACDGPNGPSGPSPSPLRELVINGPTQVGVAGPTRLRLSKTGFADQMIDATVTDHTRQDFELKLHFDSLDISGTWRLTVSASPACSSTLPEAIRQREFTVGIAQFDRVTPTDWVGIRGSLQETVKMPAIDGTFSAPSTTTRQIRVPSFPAV